MQRDKRARRKDLRTTASLTVAPLLHVRARAGSMYPQTLYRWPFKARMVIGETKNLDGRRPVWITA